MEKNLQHPCRGPPGDANMFFSPLFPVVTLPLVLRLNDSSSRRSIPKFRRTVPERSCFLFFPHAPFALRRTKGLRTIEEGIYCDTRERPTVALMTRFGFSVPTRVKP